MAWRLDRVARGVSLCITLPNPLSSVVTKLRESSTLLKYVELKRRGEWKIKKEWCGAVYKRWESLFTTDQSIIGPRACSELRNFTLQISSYRISYLHYTVNRILSDPISHPVLHGHHTAETHITSVRHSSGTFFSMDAFRCDCHALFESCFPFSSLSIVCPFCVVCSLLCSSSTYPSP